MTPPTHLRWSRIAIVTTFIIFAGAAAAYLRYLPPATSFDRRVVTPRAGFTYHDPLTCTILFATHRAGPALRLPWLEVPSFTLTGLGTDRPTMTTSYYPNGIVMRKVYDSTEYVVLEYADQQWDTMTIGILKTAGTFVQTASGIQAGDARFQYATAMKGTCR